MKTIKTAQYQKMSKEDPFVVKDKECDADLLAEGIRAEMETTFSRAIAKEIAMDNLAKNPNHYKKA